MMVKFMDFLQKNSHDFIRADEHWKWRGYGDWLSNNADTPTDLIGTAFYAHCANLMSKIAGIIGKSDDVPKYTRLFLDVRKAWLDRYVTPAGLITSQTQTACVLASKYAAKLTRATRR